MFVTVLEITDNVRKSVKWKKKKILHIYKYIHAAFSCIVAHSWLVIWATSVECSALCRSIWLLAAEKMSCLCDSPDSWRPDLRTVPDCLWPWGSAVAGEGDGCLPACEAALCCTWTWAAAPPPCSPWPPAGAAQVTRQARWGRVGSQAEGPWPSSGTPGRSWAFSSPGLKIKCN